MVNQVSLACPEIEDTQDPLGKLWLDPPAREAPPAWTPCLARLANPVSQDLEVWKANLVSAPISLARKAYQARLVTMVTLVTPVCLACLVWTESLGQLVMTAEAALMANLASLETLERTATLVKMGDQGSMVSTDTEVNLGHLANLVREVFLDLLVFQASKVHLARMVWKVCLATISRSEMSSVSVGPVGSLGTLAIQAVRGRMDQWGL
jgi:hypothetical protein